MTAIMRWADGGISVVEPPTISVCSEFGVVFRSEHNLRSQHIESVGGSATEITPSAHLIMAVIAPWTEPFLAYLNRRELPEDQNEARCIVRRSNAYKVHDGELYKKSATVVLQRCISEEEGRQLLAEIHAGLGGHHVVAQALVSKAFHIGFYWPTARTDA